MLNDFKFYYKNFINKLKLKNKQQKLKNYKTFQ